MNRFWKPSKPNSNRQVAVCLYIDDEHRFIWLRRSTIWFSASKFVKSNDILFGLYHCMQTKDVKHQSVPCHCRYSISSYRGWVEEIKTKFRWLLCKTRIAQRHAFQLKEATLDFYWKPIACNPCCLVQSLHDAGVYCGTQPLHLVPIMIMCFPAILGSHLPLLHSQMYVGPTSTIHAKQM